LSDEAESVRLDSEPTLPDGHAVSLPLVSMNELDDPFMDITSRLTNEEEDALLKVGQPQPAIGCDNLIDF